MSLFADAFQFGKEAVGSVEAAKREVDEILKELSIEIKNSTNGNVEISYVTARDGHSSITALTRALSESAVATAPSGGGPRKFFISAHSTKVGESSLRNLALVVRPYEGYPCELSYANLSNRCHDKDALIQALRGMLQNAWIAKQLMELDAMTVY